MWRQFLILFLFWCFQILLPTFFLVTALKKGVELWYLKVFFTKTQREGKKITKADYLSVLGLSWEVHRSNDISSRHYAHTSAVGDKHGTLEICQWFDPQVQGLNLSTAMNTKFERTIKWKKNPTLIKKSFLCMKCLLLRNYSFFFFFWCCMESWLICMFLSGRIQYHWNQRTSIFQGVQTWDLLGFQPTAKITLLFLFTSFSLISTLDKTFMEKQCL